MSVKEVLPAENDGQEAAAGKGREVILHNKRRRLDKCFSFMEINMEPGKSLKKMDSEKMKSDIKKWAKAVVAYARQLSGKLGSSCR